jgi:thiol-disulfide isomerase/thioredoxin
MFRTTLLAAIGVVGQFAPVTAQERPKNDPSKQEKPIVSLKVGDLAPALTVTKWLQGDAVTKFESGKVYVVEFWATWCGACIRSMPHLAELQARYKDQGVIVISFTSRDIQGKPGSNTEEKITAFVRKRGPTLNYSFAYGDDDTTFDAWVKAAGLHALPRVFVLDKAGRIAYIGSPLFLDLVLQKVVAGGASAKAIGDEMDKVEAEYETVCARVRPDRGAFPREPDPEAFLRALKDFEAKYPPLADCMPAVSVKLHELLKHGDPGQAKEYAEALVSKAIKNNNVPVLQLAYLQLCEKKESKELVALAVRAAEALVRIDGGKDAYSLICLADAYLISGDNVKAKEYARKAIAAAAGESSADRQEIEKEARRLGAEK